MILSIIVPVYKIEEPYFRECLNSLVAIENKDVEIILVDDGSPDNCGAICDEYAKKDTRVRVLHKENAGVSAARNDGIRMAQGEYITFVDADDWVDAEILEESLQEVLAVSSDVLFYGGNHIFESVNKQTFAFDTPQIFKTQEEKEKLQKMVLGIECDLNCKVDDIANMYSVWACFFRRALIVKNALLFKENLSRGEDSTFLFSVLQKCGEVSFFKKAFYFYRERRTSVTHLKASSDFFDVVCLCDELKRLIRENNLDDSFVQALNYRIFNEVTWSMQAQWAIGKSTIGTFIEKSKAIRREYKKEPFKTAIKQVKYSDYHLKGKVKVFLFKAHLPELFLLMKWMLGKVKKEKLH